MTDGGQQRRSLLDVCVENENEGGYSALYSNKVTHRFSDVSDGKKNRET